MTPDLQMHFPLLECYLCLYLITWRWCGCRGQIRRTARTRLSRQVTTLRFCFNDTKFTGSAAPLHKIPTMTLTKRRNNDTAPMISFKITRRYTMQIESTRRQATRGMSAGRRLQQGRKGP